MSERCIESKLVLNSMETVLKKGSAVSSSTPNSVHGRVEKNKIPGGYLSGQPLLHCWSMSYRGSAGGAPESDVVNCQQPGHCLYTVPVLASDVGQYSVDSELPKGSSLALAGM